MALKRSKHFNFKDIKTNFIIAKRKIPLRLANDIQRHFLKGFRRGGGSTDASIGGWKPRKHSRSARERKRSVGRALLVRSGKMRSDIKKRKISFNKTIVGTRSIPYAGYINEGTSKMPKREFIGNSRVLERQIEQKLLKEFDKVFKI